MTQEQILELTTFKHIKIWKLHKLCLTNKDIASALGTNAGHVFNVIKDYKENSSKVEAADKI
jgi:transcriptional regulator